MFDWFKRLLERLHERSLPVWENPAPVPVPVKVKAPRKAKPKKRSKKK